MNNKTTEFKSIFFWIFLFLTSTLGLQAQDLLVKGEVKDDQGEPLIGVSVSIQGTQRGTVTNYDGEYSIRVSEGEELAFSYMGMKPQTVKVGKSDVINIIMVTDTQLLDEAVVIGYGTAKKQDLTGSIGTVSSSDILKQPSMNAVQSVQGKMSGVNITATDAPGSNPSVIIRGLGTVLGGREPLYIVDGFPTDNISTISPTDIISMSVLKDASSASIYGLRAANGVILITTKKGEKGAPKINIETYAGAKTVLNKVKMANAQQYITFFNENQAALASQGNSNTFKLADADRQPFNTNWYDELLKTGFFNNNTVSVSGGGNTVDYFLSYNYFNEKGILEDQTYNRSTIRNNNIYRFFDDRLKISQNINISFSNNHPKPFGAFNSAYRQSPLVAKKYSNGLYGLPYADSDTGIMWAQAGDESNAKLNSIGNPLLAVSNANEKSQTFTLQGGFDAEIKIFDYLKANTRIGITKYWFNKRVFTDIKRNWINTENVGRTEAEFEKYKTDNPGSTTYANNSLVLSNSDSFRWTWEGFLTLNKTVGKNNVEAVGGMSAERYNIGNSSVMTGYDVPAKSNYWSINHASEDYTKLITQYQMTQTTLASFFGRLQYNYDYKYYLSATIRRDGSSNFKQGGNYWGTFPSIGLGWTVTSEEFMKKFPQINYLKLRATWGKLGNQNIPFNYTTYNVNQGSGTGNYVFGDQYYQGAIIGTPAKNLSWEITRETGFGFDVNFLNNRLSAGFDYYDKLNTNVILQVTPIYSSQYSANYYDHVGKINNRGIEFNVGWSDILPVGLTYEINFNYSYNRNKVKDLEAQYEGRTGGNLSDGQITKRLSNNHSIFGWWMFQADGIWQSQQEIDEARANGEGIYGTPYPGYIKYKDVTGDGTIGNADKVYAGSYLPSSNYGVHIALGYNKWDFSLDGYGVAGNKIYNGLKYGRIDGGENIAYDTFKDRWTGPGSTNKNPGANRQAVASTYYLESGSFFRINNITLGYTFKNILLMGTNLRIYATAQNPFIFTKYKGFSPEIIGDESGSPSGTAGIELSAYPSTRNILAGFNLQF